jgi:hypothetical protein
MKNFLRSRDLASKGAALLIVLAIVIMLAGVALAYLSRTTTDRQLAQMSYNDTSADLLARSALDIVVGDFKQEILAHPTVTPGPPFYITPVPYGTPTGGPTVIPNLIRRSFSSDPTNRTSSVSSSAVSANGRSINTTRWNSHYLIPKGDSSTTDSSPVPSFSPPDWVLVTPQGPAQAPTPSAVIGRYAFAVYDEGGLLDMSVAGAPIDHPNDSSNRSWPSLAGCSSPSPTPWLVNVGRKGIVTFADLTALPAAPSTFFPQSQIDNIVGWRNYAMTQRAGANFGNFNSTYTVTATTECAKQDWYGSYLLNFGDPPFLIDSLSDKLLASNYPFTSVANYAYPTPGPGVSSRTDQALTTRQQLLSLRKSLGFSPNVLQYMGTFSRERNRPAPDWPGLNGSLSEGRFNLNNLALLIPNPSDCFIAHGKKKGWQTGKNKNHLCGTTPEIVSLFGLFWVKANILDGTLHTPGHWKYIGNVSGVPDPDGTPDPHGIGCLGVANRQSDFFQVLNYALYRSNCAPDGTIGKTFALGASLIDQYDDATFDPVSDTGCPTSGPNNGSQPPGCDLDSHVVGNNWNKAQYATHTTVIEYGHNGNHNHDFAYGMEKDQHDDSVNGDRAYDDSSNSLPHRPCGGANGGACVGSQAPAPTPVRGGPTPTQVLNRSLSTVGEFSYGIDTSIAGVPTAKFWDSSTSPPFQFAPVLDFFSYNPVSSAYPRAGIVNLYTKNAPVIAAMLKATLKNETLTSPPATGVVSQTEAMNAAIAIVIATQSVLAGTASPAVQQTDLTRAIAGRLANVGSTAAGWSSDEQKEAIARGLAEMGQTRTWNLLIDVIAQTGKYKPNASDLTGSNFVVEGEKRYWLHIALGRDLNSDGSVDVLGTQLEEVVE